MIRKMIRMFICCMNHQLDLVETFIFEPQRSKLCLLVGQSGVAKLLLVEAKRWVVDDNH
jgi:hypothetical protein